MVIVGDAKPNRMFLTVNALWGKETREGKYNDNQCVYDIMLNGNLFRGCLGRKHRRGGT